MFFLGKKMKRKVHNSNPEQQPNFSIDQTFVKYKQHKQPFFMIFNITPVN